MNNALKPFFFLYKLYIGLLFVITLLIFYLPITILLSKEKWKQKSFAWFLIWSRLFQILAFMPFKIQQKGKLPNSSVIICANHTSYLDILLLPSLMSRFPFVFIGKQELLSYPLIKTFFKKLHIPVDRSSKIQSARSFVKVNNAYKSGWSIAIFPEGGIPDNIAPQMIPFKNGAFKLAIDNGATIVPITFLNNYKLLSEPAAIFGSARPGFCKVIIHEAITPKDYEQLTVDQLNEKVYQTISAPLQNFINFEA